MRITTCFLTGLLDKLSIIADNKIPESLRSFCHEKLIYSLMFTGNPALSDGQADLQQDLLGFHYASRVLSSWKYGICILLMANWTEGSHGSS